MSKHVHRVALALSAVASLALTAPAWGDTFEVTRTGDPAPGNCTPNDCSLREAVLAANNDSPGPDRVVLPNRKRRYELTIPNADPMAAEDGGLEGDLDVTNGALTIVHNGKGLATVDANGHDRVIDAFARLTVRQIKLTGGNADANSSDGGAIRSGDFRLVLIGSRLIDNRGNDAGALQIGGSVRIVDSAVIRNKSSDDAGGMRLNSDGGPPNAIIRSRFIGNIGDDDGGAIDYSQGGGTLLIDRSTFAGNRVLTAGGGAIDMTNTDIVRIRNSTFSGNEAAGDGGAIRNTAGTLNIVNSTFSRNRADDSGGGIYADNSTTVSLNAVTVVRNVADADNTKTGSAGGLSGFMSTFTVANSLIALNDQLSPGIEDCYGTFDSLGGNLISDETGCDGFDHPSDMVRSNPKIGQLAANGGPTKTVGLKRGSPAIGNARKTLAPKRDQRGRRRDSKPDLGAFERGA